ncbi:2004_t:CDS:2, partial [Ambispora leptoticha]
LETGKIERGILNKDPVGTNTTIQTNYKSSIGRDNQTHVDDMTGRKYIKLDVPNHSAGSSSCPYERGGYCTDAHGGQKDNKQFRGVGEEGAKVILSQNGDTWELAFVGTIEITETLGNPDAIGSGVEINDPEELVPDLEDETQTEGLDNLEQNMEPEEEK